MIPIKKLDFWIENNLNVLLIGSHGIGKTSIVQSAFDRHGIKWRYFSAATMDPWVDFIGVPKEKQSGDTSYLELIRPKDFAEDEVEFIFFDEFNRAPSKVRNAVMELIQFKSINGRKFHNLRGIWAAINPHDDEGTYDVERLDPAHEDRFHIHFTLPTKPDLDFFIGKYGKDVGVRAVNWWNQLPDSVKDLVSPRRLDLATDLVSKGGDPVDMLHKSVRPKTFKSAITVFGNNQKSSENPVDMWKVDPAGYFASITAGSSTSNFAEQFAGSIEVGEDMAATYVPKCDVKQLRALCHKVATCGLVIKNLDTLHSKQHKAVINEIKTLAPSTYWVDDIADFMSRDDSPYTKTLLKLNAASHNLKNWLDLEENLRTTKEDLKLEQILCTYVAIGERVEKIQIMAKSTSKLNTSSFSQTMRTILDLLCDKTKDIAVFGHMAHLTTVPFEKLYPPAPLTKTK